MDNLIELADKKSKLRTKAVIATVFMWLCVVLDMSFIFVMSSQDREQSQKTSDNVIEFVVEKVEPEYKNYSPEQKSAVISKYSNTTRKIAHFVLYCLMGFFCLDALWAYPQKWAVWKKCALSFGICALYAITDELHQGAVPGRSPQVTDVLLDSLGSTVGIAVALWLLHSLTCKLIQRKNNEIYKETMQ